MEFKFEKGSPQSEQPAAAQEKGRQTGLLVLLLVLVGGFGYVYFFTGLIRPQESPPASQPPPQIVKQPLPARDGSVSQPAPASDQKKAPAAAPQTSLQAIPQAAKPAGVPAAVKEAAPASRPEEKKPAAAKPTDQAAAKTAAPAALAVKKPEAAKPAEVPAKQAVPAGQATPATQAAKKPEAVKPAPTPAKPSSPVTSTASAAKPEPPKPAAVPAASAQKTPAPIAEKKPAVKTGPWSVVVGNYLVEEALAADMAQARKLGFSPVITTGPKRPAQMHRLLVGDYDSKEAGQQALERLRQAGGNGFLVQRGERHELYAGSYVAFSGSQAEQQRLAAAGIKTQILKVQVPMASRKLTVGSYADRAGAEAAMKKLKTAGIGTPVLE